MKNRPRQQRQRTPKTSGSIKPIRNSSREPHPAQGTIIELTVDRIAHGGVGVARTDEGRVVFVSDSIPGERVRARVAEASNKSFWRADTLEVIESSPHRIEHFWPEARLDRDPDNRAGGADFGHIDLSHQRALKQQVLEDSLKRFGKVSDALLSTDSGADIDTTVRPLHDDQGLGWRTRIRLQVNERGELGVFSPRTHRIIPVSSFPLATDELLNEAPLGQLFEGASSLALTHTSTGQYSITIDDLPSKQPLTEVAHTAYDKDGRPSSTEPRRFQLAPTGFWQVHRAAPDALAHMAVSMIDRDLFVPDAHNLDLYGGVGLFAAAIADSIDQTSRIRTVEFDESAVHYAGENLADLAHVEAVEGDTLKFLQQQLSTATDADQSRYARATILLDPPRSGAGKQVVAALGRLAPRQIIYVACDPVALSRDIALLDEQGYRLTKLRALDLFPNTHHFETVAAFVRD